MRTRRSGSRLARRWLATAAMGLAVLGARTLAHGEDRGKKAPAPYVLITGTVFRETGLALAGAQVTLAAAGDSKQARKFKRVQSVTTQRGEFVMHLPAAPMSYTVTARAPGYKAQEKPITVTAEDRVDVFFQLERASQ